MGWRYLLIAKLQWLHMNPINFDGKNQTSYLTVFKVIPYLCKFWLVKSSRVMWCKYFVYQFWWKDWYRWLQLINFDGNIHWLLKCTQYLFSKSRLFGCNRKKCNKYVEALYKVILYNIYAHLCTVYNFGTLNDPRCDIESHITVYTYRKVCGYM